MHKMILINKLKILLNEIEKCRESQNDAIISDVLSKYSQRILEMLRQIREGQIIYNKNTSPFLVGILRPISEFDSLSQNKALYKAALEAETYFGKYFVYKSDN